METLSCHLFVYVENVPHTSVMQTGIRRDLSFLIAFSYFSLIFIFRQQRVFTFSSNNWSLWVLGHWVKFLPNTLHGSFSEQDEILATAKHHITNIPPGPWNISSNNSDNSSNNCVYIMQVPFPMPLYWETASKKERKKEEGRSLPLVAW